MAEQYNFMSGASGSLPMGVYQRASQTRAASKDPYYQLNTAIKQHELEAARWTMHAKAFAMQEAVNQKRGIAELGSIISDPTFSFDSEDSEMSFLQTAAKYGLGEDAIKPYTDRFNSARELKRRATMLQQARDEAAAAGMVPAGVGVSASGQPTMDWVNPNAPGARGLSFNERMELMRAEQDALTNRELMRHDFRQQMVEDARQWEALKYLDERNVKLYLADLDAISRTSYSSKALSENIERLKEEYQIKDSSVTATKPTVDPDESAPVQITAPPPTIRKFNPATGRVE